MYRDVFIIILCLLNWFVFYNHIWKTHQLFYRRTRCCHNYSSTDVLYGFLITETFWIKKYLLITRADFIVCFTADDYSSFSDIFCLHSNLTMCLICVIHLGFYSNFVKEHHSFVSFHLSWMFSRWYRRWSDCKIVTTEKSATYLQLLQLLSYKPASKSIYQKQNYCEHYPFDVLTIDVFFLVNFFERLHGILFWLPCW